MGSSVFAGSSIPTTPQTGSPRVAHPHHPRTGQPRTTVAGPGDSWRTGGSPTWITGSYDPDLNLVYWGTGNPGPDWNGDVRMGDNLYADSALALDGDTGDMAWFFQFTPHDVHDWDAIQVPILADIEFEGETRKVMMWGQSQRLLLHARSGNRRVPRWEAVCQTDVGGRARRERPTDPGPRHLSRRSRAPSCLPPSPGAPTGGRPPTTRAPVCFYVNAFDGEAKFFIRDEAYQEGEQFHGGRHRGCPAERQVPHSAIRAIDPATGDRRWEFPIWPRSSAGILTTAGNLVFSGSNDGYVYALDATSGEELWHITVGRPRAFRTDDLRRARPAVRHDRPQVTSCTRSGWMSNVPSRDRAADGRAVDGPLLTTAQTRTQTGIAEQPRRSRRQAVRPVVSLHRGNASYSIDVGLDTERRTLTGREVLTWRNISGIATDDLQFHLYYNAWKKHAVHLDAGASARPR